MMLRMAIMLNRILCGGYYRLQKCTFIRTLSMTSRKLREGNFTHYGGRKMITLIPGDGIGPEVTDAVKKVFNSAGVPVDFEEVNLTGANYDEETSSEAIMSIKRNAVGLKGNIETDIAKLEIGQNTANVLLRLKLGLFANVMKVKSVPGVITRHDNIDIRIIRENTEGEYSNLEHESVGGIVESYKVITAENSLRIAEFAFNYARRNNRKKVTAVHKANIMKMADGLFLDSCEKTAEKYPDIEFNSIIVDNATMQMVSNPWQFDVMVMPNLYGNILGNICCGLVGGPGIVAGANIGEEWRVFETATRNTGMGLVGKNLANPAAMLFSSALMLKYIGLHKYAKLINKTVVETIQVDGIRTPDLGGKNTTSEMVDVICEKVAAHAYTVRYDQTPLKSYGW